MPLRGSNSATLLEHSLSVPGLILQSPTCPDTTPQSRVISEASLPFPATEFCLGPHGTSRDFLKLQIVERREKPFWGMAGEIRLSLFIFFYVVAFIDMGSIFTNIFTSFVVVKYT